VRPDYKLIAALLAPLLIWPWVPVWNDDVVRAGLIGAAGLAVSASVLEEVLFRGFLQGWLLNQARFKQSLLCFTRANWLTSLAFAAAHSWTHMLLLVPGYFAVGMVLGYFRERYNGILVPVLLHSYYNLGLLYFSMN
jgi:membrane protease YdiL (CAAX protease family)